MATPLGIQLYTVREAFAEDRAAALANVAAKGFRNVEAFGIGDLSRDKADRIKDAQEFRAQLDDNGLTLVSTHGTVASDDSAEEIYDELEVLGTDRLIAPVPGAVKGFAHDVLSTRDGVNRIAEALNDAAEKAKSRGIKIGYHNHDFEWQPVEDGTPAYDQFVRNLSDDVFIELDIYWTATAGQKPADVAALYANKIILLHVKDGPAKRGELQTTVGQGVVDNVGAIINATMVEYHIVELDESAGDPFDDAATGGQWLVDNGHSTWA